MIIGKAIVLEYHTLAVVMENGLQILRASVLRGSPYLNIGTLAPLLPTDKWRYATEYDFKDFHVTCHPDYIV